MSMENASHTLETKWYDGSMRSGPSETKLDVTACILLPLVAIALLVGCPAAPELADGATISQDLLVVATTPAARSELHRVRELHVGRIVAPRVSHLGFQAPGVLDAIFVDEGSLVAEGEIIARLDVRSLRQERKVLAARVEELHAQRKLASLRAQRERELHARGATSDRSLEESIAEEAALGARLDGALAAVAQLDVSLELSELIAPYPSNVTVRYLDERAVVAPGQPIVELVEAGTRELRVDLPEQTARSLQRDTIYEVEVGHARIPARLQSVTGAVDLETGLVPTTLLLDVGEQVPSHGSLGRLELERTIHEPGFWLPLTALTEGRRGLWSVFALVPDADGAEEGVTRVERRVVRVLHMEAGRAFVQGTLSDGDLIARHGLHRLVPGQRVRAAPSPPDAVLPTDTIGHLPASSSLATE